MQNQTLIFIPDITGFTSFVNRTAIEHSQHIISELLEIIIDADRLGFSISEIEGDAVLFYKNDWIPNFSELLEQTKEMFLKFHTHLDEIEQANVCQCGACKTASKLSLKFIAHVGSTEEVKVKQFNKLIGSDLILAHRLCKNSINFNEYFLATEKYIGDQIAKITVFDDWIEINSSSEIIDEFGTVPLKYIDYSPLLEKVPALVKKNESKEYNRKADISTHINAPILLVHNILTDIESKYDYAPQIKKIITDDKINRISSSHTCVFDNQEIHFVTKNNSVSRDQISYSEEAQLKKGFKFITDYRLKEQEGKTELSIYVFKSKIAGQKSQSILIQIKNYFLLKLIILASRKGIKDFKNYCEKIYLESGNYE